MLKSFEIKDLSIELHYETETLIVIKNVDTGRIIKRTVRGDYNTRNIHKGACLGKLRNETIMVFHYEINTGKASVTTLDGFTCGEKYEYEDEFKSDAELARMFNEVINADGIF